MEEVAKPMSKSDAGNATGFFSSSPHDLGESDAQDAKPQTKDDLLGALDALEKHRHNIAVTCHVANVLEQLSAAEAAKLEQVLATPEIRGTWIVETLGKHGFKVSASSVQRHRRRYKGGGCVCP
jgi:hypothetical protein